MPDTESNGVQDAEQRPRARRAASRPAGPPRPATATEQPETPPAPSSAPSAVQQPETQTRVIDDQQTPEAEQGTDALLRPPVLLFQPPEPAARAARAKAPADSEADASAQADSETSADEEAEDDTAAPRRRRRRGGRGRRGRARDETEETSESQEQGEGHEGRPEEPTQEKTRKRQKATPSGKSQAEATGERAGDAGSARGADTREGGGSSDDEQSASTRRRRRRRRRGGEGGEPEAQPDDPERTVVRVREPRPDAQEDVESVKGSTRLEAKRQRRREGRAAGRRRAPIITEAEFLARREAVDRQMVVRRVGDRIQVGVLEDGILVEHYVSTSRSSTSVGNVYLGKVQNVLPSMEAAFVDIGRGRNAVLYAGEVNFDLAGLEGQPKRIESALKSGQSVLVQATKDPIAQKGARLTSQVSLPGRYLVYVPEGSMTGISRKLPDTERTRLKSVLKKVVPEGAGVIVRTAAEGASEDELARDVARLEAQWEDIQKKSRSANAPALLYSEPDLAIRVVRDIFNEDFSKLVVSGDEEWGTLSDYVRYVAPDLAERMTRWTDKEDVFSAHRIDEQIAKALDRKVWLPSGGSLVIDRTEAMTVIDVNTGKFTGKGGNLEETVTKNNLEAAEEIVRQLRLRDIGGIIVIDFIDMVLESNRDLVLRRLLECLGRDRTKHQVAEVTSLGLVQMTRKRVGQGLLEAFSEACEHCNGRGLRIRTDAPAPPDGESGGTRRKRGKGNGEKAPQKASSKAKKSGRSGKNDQVRRADAEAIAQVAAAATGSQDEPATVAEVLEPAVEPVADLDQSAGAADSTGTTSG